MTQITHEWELSFKNPEKLGTGFDRKLHIFIGNFTDK